MLSHLPHNLSATTAENDEAKPDLKLRVYDDNWKWKEGERWRESGAGHGYWRGGIWIMPVAPQAPL